MDRGRTISALAAPVATKAVGSESSDHDLVAATRAGDDRAFECLYERYHRRIAAFVHGMVHDHARAEDITQDVFMSALRRMRQTERPIAFKPWIYEIAKNACIDAFRRSKRAEEVSFDADEGFGAADYGRLVSPTATPDVAVETKMRLDDLRGAFGGLSETHHEILVMRELEGLSYREIGDRLGMTRPSVESTLFRARRRLEEEYEELSTGARCTRVQGIIAAADGKAVGARDQRRMTRHISYCQPCRRQARLAGLDVAVTARRPMREKIAGFLPLPAFLKKRLAGGDGASGGGLGEHAPAMAQWSAHVAAHGDSAVAGWSKAAAAAVAVAVAGFGAGAASERGAVQAQAGQGMPVVQRGDGPSASEAVRLQAAIPAGPGRAGVPLSATALPTPASGTAGTRAGAGATGGSNAGSGGGSGSSSDPASSGSSGPSGSGGSAGSGGSTGGGTSGSGGTVAPAAGGGILQDAARGLGLPGAAGGSAPSAPRPSTGSTGVTLPDAQAPSSPAPKVDAPVGEAVTGVTDSVGKATEQVTSGATGVLGGN
jgi:RNA polymerase sigma factor (sigma-70 family)